MSKRKLDSNDNDNNIISKKKKICENGIELINSIAIIKKQLNENVKKCDKIMKKIKKILYNNCDHDTYRDFSSCGPSDRPEKICKKCNLVINDYLYR
jgi:hypothetical protein